MSSKLRRRSAKKYLSNLYAQPYTPYTTENLCGPKLYYSAGDVAEN